LRVAALLDHGGSLGALLSISELFESGDFSRMEELAGECGLSSEQAARAELEAFHWVQDMGMNDPG
jgi:c-di-GMP-related signal transduction protein